MVGFGVWSLANLWQLFQSVKHLTSSSCGPHLINWHFIFFHYNIFEKKNILESWHSPIYLRECQSHWYICSSLGLLRSERQEEGDTWMFKYFKVQRTFYQRGFNIKIGGLTNGWWEVVDSKVKIFIKRMLNNSIETNRRPSKVIQANYFIATWESETLHPMRTWVLSPPDRICHAQNLYFCSLEKALLRKCIWKCL